VRIDAQSCLLVVLALHVLSAATCCAINSIELVSSTTEDYAWLSYPSLTDSMTLVADSPAVGMAHVVVTRVGLHEVIVSCLLLLAVTLRVSG
jgi:hypothetical protein